MNVKVERWHRVSELFDRVVDLGAYERDQVLTAECSSDPTLRAEVERMLAADERPCPIDTDIAARASSLLLEGDPRAHEGECFGPYRIVRLLGQGGMGRVYLAEREGEDFAQIVALKLVGGYGSFDAKEARRRFLHERRILARLQHPHIARLLDGGVGPQAQPWFAMEYVDGAPLTEWCDARRLSVVERLVLFAQVCDAVDHAHRFLVVHRDIKPSNVLVDDAGKAKVLDFGIAKLLDEGELALAGSTAVMTADYAAPEQIRGGQISTATDIYALGVVLFELLTGRKPFSDPLAPREPPQASRVATEGDVKSNDRAVTRGTTPKGLSRRLRGDLDRILRTSLNPDPLHRYRSAVALGQDLIAVVEGRAISLRNDSLYRVRVFLGRHKRGAAAAALALLGLLGTSAWALWQSQAARTQAREAQAVVGFMRNLFTVADPDRARGEHVTARELLTRGASGIRGRFADQPRVRAELLTTMAEAMQGIGLYADALPLAEEGSQLGRDLDAVALRRTADLSRARSLFALGRFDEALVVLEPLRMATSSDKEAQIISADAAYERARALQALNRLDAADLAYREAYGAQTQLHGVGDRRSQDTAMRYVALLVLRDRMQDAAKLARATLASVRRVTSVNDPHLADAIASLAMVLTNSGPLTEAETLWREEYAIRRQAQGAEHPDTINALNNLAGAQFAQRQFAEAATTYRDALDKNRAQFGSDHPLVATVANNLATCELELDRPHSAKPLAEEALRIRTAHYGRNHYATAGSLLTLGAAEIELGDYAAAERRLRAAIAAYDAAMGPDNTLVAPALRELARVQVLSGRPDPQCVAAERAYALSVSHEQDPTRRAYVNAHRAACQIAAGRAEASRTLAADLTLLSRHWGKADRRTRKVAALVSALSQ